MNRIKIAMSKLSSIFITERMLSASFKETLSQFEAHTKTYSFISSVKDVSALEKIINQVTLMMKQLGVAAF